MPRPTCPNCLRPESACYCSLAHKVKTETEVLILQHPLEAKAAKNTARLLHLCLSNSSLEIGEQWESLPVGSNRSSDRTPVLLYPSDEKTSHTVDINELTPGNTQLVVLDGTWRKTRKMLHLSPYLQQLPRVAMQPRSPSAYRIRKTPNDEALSTFEAVCAYLEELEPDCDPENKLLDSFGGFLNLWESLRNL